MAWIRMGGCTAALLLSCGLGACAGESDGDAPQVALPGDGMAPAAGAAGMSAGDALMGTDTRGGMGSEASPGMDPTAPADMAADPASPPAGEGDTADAEPGPEPEPTTDPAPNPPTPPAGADPGTAPWQPVPAEEVAEICGLDPELLAAADVEIGRSYAVVRRGRLCHEHYPQGQPQQGDATHVFSTSKTLAATAFGVAVYQTRDLPESGPRTGPLSDLDRMDTWIDADSITFNRDARVAHVLAMTGYNADLSHGAKMFEYDADGSREIQRLADVAEAAIAQDAARLGTGLEQFAVDFLLTPLGMQASTWSSFSGPPPMAYGWNATVRDMLRLGVLLIHDGTWNGERILDADWVYKMTHPAFEDANASYGYLTWLGAVCAPAPRWPSYPHGLSEATDCGGPFGCAEQQYDVGVWQALGFGGQVIQGHKGLDLVLAVKDFDPRGGNELWNAVRPALVALDPRFAGDDAAFCAAYGAGDYAPDL